METYYIPSVQFCMYVVTINESIKIYENLNYKFDRENFNLNLNEEISEYDSYEILYCGLSNKSKNIFVKINYDNEENKYLYLYCSVQLIKFKSNSVITYNKCKKCFIDEFYKIYLFGPRIVINDYPRDIYNNPHLYYNDYNYIFNLGNNFEYKKFTKCYINNIFYNLRVVSDYSNHFDKHMKSNKLELETVNGQKIKMTKGLYCYLMKSYMEEYNFEPLIICDD